MECLACPDGRVVSVVHLKPAGMGVASVPAEGVPGVTKAIGQCYGACRTQRPHLGHQKSRTRCVHRSCRGINCTSATESHFSARGKSDRGLRLFRLEPKAGYCGAYDNNDRDVP